MENYKFFPDFCPNCNSKLIIEEGQKSGVIKLSCKNTNCSGTKIKKLQKGFAVLEIRGIGPAVVEKFYNAGLNDIIDVFNKETFTKEYLINSGYFKKGRALDKIFESLDKFKEVSIEKAIQSLQIMVEKDSKDGYISIGKSISLEIGKYLSNVPYNFEGLSLQIRNDIASSDSKLLKEIRETLVKLEERGIIVNKFEVKQKPKTTKKLSKRVFLSNEISEELPESLGWEIVDTITEDCDLVITNSKKEEDIITKAKQNNIKTMTFKQVKLLFL